MTIRRILNQIFSVAAILIVVSNSYAQRLAVNPATGKLDLVSTELSDFTDVGTATQGTGRLLISDGVSFNSVVMNGDCTMTASGNIDCPSGTPTTLGDLTDVGTATQGRGRLLVSDGATFGSVDTIYVEPDGNKFVGIGTTSPSDALSFGTNKDIFLTTDRPTLTTEGSIKIKSEDCAAKATIAYIDEFDDEVIWLQTHNWLDDACTTTQHKHFSIEASDASGNKQTRLGVGYGADIVDITMNQSDLVINRNTGETNGNIEMAGGGGGGVWRHAGSFSMYPEFATNATYALKTSLEGGSNDQVTLSAIGSTILYVDDNINLNAAQSLYLSTTGSLGLGTTTPLHQLTVEKSGASGTTAGPKMEFRQNQTSINTTTNSTIGEILFSGADVFSTERGTGARIRAEASNIWNGTTNDYPTDLIFSTTPNGSGALTERLRILAEGGFSMETQTPGRLLVSDGAAFHSVALSGDCTITASGVIDCPSGAVSQLSDLSDVGTATQGSGRLLISDGANFASAAMSGDATINASGVIKINQFGDVSGGNYFKVNDTGIDLIGDFVFEVSNTEPAFVDSADHDRGMKLFNDRIDITDDGGSALFQFTDATASNPGYILTTAGFDVIGANDIDYGSADVTDHTFITDGTGTSEIVLPANSIDNTEIDFIGLVTQGAGRFLISDGATFGSVTLSGDATINASGVLTVSEPRTLCKTLENPADADDNIPLWAFREAITITDVYCNVNGSSTPSIAITLGDGTNSLEAITCDDDGAEDDGSITNGSFTSLEVIEIDHGAPSGTVNWELVCITFTQ